MNPESLLRKNTMAQVADIIRPSHDSPHLYVYSRLLECLMPWAQLDLFFQNDHDFLQGGDSGTAFLYFNWNEAPMLTTE